ncbi:MAG TPA: putative baseplate assembly protein [Kofleriaceae bacterium]|nr:putative baseplate assembly protein [Kofleriaceae bacterium]
MSGPWWGKDVSPELAAAAADAAASTDALLAPLTTTDPAAIARELDARRSGFTPTWTSRRPDDPGVALQAVYGEMHATVAGGVDDLWKKARVEHLVAAGVVQAPPRPLAAMLVFEVSDGAPEGVLVGQGFAVFGRDSDGNSVTFETDRDLFAIPGKLAVLGSRARGSIATQTIPTDDAPGTVYPFTLAPKQGVQLYLAIDAPVAPAPQIAIGVTLAPVAGLPPPMSAGGLMPPPGHEPPRLQWELFDRGKFTLAEVIRDETRSFTQSGVIELEAPPGWRAGTPPGAEAKSAMYWIRAQILEGEWPAAPAISALTLNVVPATSGRTVRDEAVETPLTVDPAARRTLTLAQKPVLAGSLFVQIDEGGSELVTWTAVDDLSQAGFDERKFRFDAVAGTLTFGDGVNGRPLPEGFRNVHATYRVAESANSVAAKQISTLIGSAPFLTSVTNPLPAGGGAPPETLDAALVRGPRDIRARGRAVAPADFEVLALRATGADIRRAKAFGGFHPRFPGLPIPGVVGVYVVGAARDDGQPPVPTEQTLGAVSQFLSTWAARGAEVVAAAPVFHGVRVEASFELDPHVDVTTTIHEVSGLLDDWFDPVIGGASGQGWPFGGTIYYDELIRFLLEKARGVIAVPRLLVVVDGVRSVHCADVAIPPRDLLWPAQHELIPLPRRRS